MLTIVAIYLNHSPVFQILILIGVNTFTMCVEALIRPGKTFYDNRLAKFDDISYLLIIDCMLCCTDFVSDSTGRYNVGFIILFLTLQNLMTNLILMLIDTVRSIINLFKKCMNIRRKTKGKTTTYLKKNFKKKIRKGWS